MGGTQTLVVRPLKNTNMQALKIVFFWVVGTLKEEEGVVSKIY